VLGEQLGFLKLLQLECLEIRFDRLFMLEEAHELLRNALHALAKQSHFRESFRTVRFDYSEVTAIYSASHWIHPVLLFSRELESRRQRFLRRSLGNSKPQPFALEIVGICDDKEDGEEREAPVWDASIASDLARGPLTAFTMITFIDCFISPVSVSALFRHLAGNENLTHLAFLGCHSGLDHPAEPTSTLLGSPWFLFDALPAASKARVEHLAVHQELGTSTSQFEGVLCEPPNECLPQLCRLSNLRTLITDDLPNANDLPASLERLRVSDVGHVETLSRSLLAWTQILDARISNKLPKLAEFIIEIRHDRGFLDIPSKLVHPTYEEFIELARRYAEFRLVARKAQVVVSGLAHVVQERLAWGRMLARLEGLNETLAEIEGDLDLDDPAGNLAPRI
jgi:hypothetical protein